MGVLGWGFLDWLRGRDGDVFEVLTSRKAHILSCCRMRI